MGFRMVGANCCCGSCVLFEDRFERVSLGDDWDVITGSPAIAAGTLELSNGDLVLVTSTYDQDTPLVVSCWVSNLVTTGDKFRVIVAYTSSTNYLYAQLEKVSGFAAAELKLFQRTLFGGHTQIGTTRTVSGWDGQGEFSVCWQDGVLAAEIYYQDASLIFHRVIASKSATGATGLRHGIACGGGADLVCDDYRLSIHENEQIGCPNCGRFCANCENETEPRRYQITIAGVTGTYACANGTYLIDGGDCGGSLVIDDCPVTINPLSMSISESGGVYYLRVQFSIPCGFGASAYVWEADFVDPVPCLTLEDYEVPGSGYTDVCLVTGFDAATCHVTALAL